MRHGIGERPLQEALFGGASQLGSRCEVAGQVFKHRVKALDLSLKVWQRLCPVATSLKERACIAQDAGHVTNQIGGSSYLLARLKRNKRIRRTAQSLLGAVSNGCEKMPEHRTLLIHDDRSLQVSGGCELSGTGQLLYRVQRW
jgi:hypothetical protein